MSTNSNVLHGKELVIFDVDGVIFDIIEAIRETVKVGIEKYDLKSRPQEAMQQVSHLLEVAQSMPIPKMILQSKELFDIPLFGEMTVLKRLRIAASFYGDFRTRKDECGIFPGIDEIILGLKKAGYKLAIFSNNKKSYVLEALRKHDLQGNFAQILGFNEVSKTKPDPEGLLKILELENVPAEKAVFIGDMVTDIKAGKAANVDTIAIASGLVARDKLEKEAPAKVVANTQELKSLFGV